MRDQFVVVCSPELLVNDAPLRSPTALSEYTLIHTHWSPHDLTAPTWDRWSELASSYYDESINLRYAQHLTFHEESQAIDAVINGAGILIVSDFLVARELEDGTLVKVLDFSLPGYGFYVIYRRDHPNKKIFESFESWVRSSVL